MRGCERKIIMLKGTGSEIFDEAYFLLKKDFKSGAGEGEIVSEAQRIIACNTFKKQKERTRKREWLFFAAGSAAAAVLAAICVIVF